MRDDLFQELLGSIREAKAIDAGTLRGARATIVRPRHDSLKPVDVLALRRSMKLSQAKFASLLGISARTLQGWEQGRRAPLGPAKVLLQVARYAPEIVLHAVMESATYAELRAGGRVGGRAGGNMVVHETVTRPSVKRNVRKSNSPKSKR